MLPAGHRHLPFNPRRLPRKPRAWPAPPRRTGRLSLGTPTRGAQRVSNRGCSHTATSRTEGQGPKEWEWMPSQQRRTGHLPREGMLTQGTDTHLGGTFTQKGTLTGRGYSPGRDTRQGGPLTREGHSPGRDTHQEGTLTREGHSPGRDTHSREGTLTRRGHSPGRDTILIIWVMKIFFVQFCVFLLPLLNLFCFC